MTDPAAHPFALDSLGDRLYAEADRLVQRGCVSGVRVLQAGTVVTGIVAGEPQSTASSARRVGTYRVYVRLGGGRIEGECSCEQHQPCVHVAAVLIYAAKGAHQPSQNSWSVAGSQARQIDQAHQPAASSSARSPTQRQQLCYLLETTRIQTSGVTRVQASGAESGSGCHLSVWVSQTALSGHRLEPHSAHPFVPRALISGERSGGDWNDAFPRYVDAEDREILKALTGQQVDGPWVLRDEYGADLWRRAGGTGRAYWQSLDSAPLRAGSVRDAAFAWEILTNGDQRLRCEPAEALTLILDVAPAMYVDAARTEWGELRLPCPQDLARQYWNNAPIAPEQVSATNAHIAREAGAAFPRLRELPLQKRPLSSLKGKLILLAAQSAATSSSGAEAVLHFVYNDLPIDSTSLRPEQQTVRRFSDDAVHEFDRDHDGEARLRAQLASAFAQSSANNTQPIEDWHREAWLAFMTNGVPALRSDGWDVVMDDRFPYRIVEPENWYGDLTPAHQESSARAARSDREREWFDLRLGVVVDGHTVNLLPVLVNYLQATLGGDSANHPIDDASYCRVGERLFVHLEDGRYVPVSMARVERIAQTLVELFDRDGLSTQHSLRLPRSQAGRLAQLMENPGTAEAVGTRTGPRLPDPIALHSDDASLLSHIEGVGAFARIRALPAPPRFRTTLRPYQQEGLGWLQFLRSNRTGGILADDMGLGKTVQTLAHLALEKHEGRLRKPTLIVAPVSVI